MIIDFLKKNNILYKNLQLTKQKNMNEVIKEVILFWEKSTLLLMEYTDEDKKEWRKLFNNWAILNKWLKDFNARWVNLPEWISEIAFCFITWSKRFIKKLNWKSSASFDTFNIETNKAEQIKACSIKWDLTSFWPKSKWDTIYFIDFFNNWVLDWTFDIYEIDTKIIKSVKVNKEQTFLEKQATWQRPRFSIKLEIIEKLWLKPIHQNVKI